jgi:penicillin G amidase
VLAFTQVRSNNSSMMLINQICDRISRRAILAPAIVLLSSFALVAVEGAPNAVTEMDGQRITVAGLERPIEIERDGYGVPTIRGERFLDVVFGHGFVQAQDRFFQIDGVRRLAAGELAALAGPTMLDMDKAARKYRFRDVAKQIVANLNDDDRAILEHYTAGVNAALDHMQNRPFEYGILQVDPQPWRPDDTVLALLGMFDMLHIEGQIERRVGVMYDALPRELAEFLTPRSSRFDALLLPNVLNEDELVNDWQPMLIPGPEVIDLRDRAAVAHPEDFVEPTPVALGSNNWAVAGSRTTDGRAILANDPHLQYMVPGVWYRSVLEWSGGRTAGLSLPGAPGIIIGANDHIAWGFTNMMGDFQDYIIIEAHPDDPSQYRTPDGYEPFGEIIEEVEVRGRGVERLTLQTTRWGVVTDYDWKGRPLVLKWTALNPEMVNFNILDMMFTETIDDAVKVARSWRGPSQNIVMADADGRIAWVVSGYLPKRIGFDGTRPVSWACGNVGWDGQVDEADRPMIVDPPSGILFTANNRTVPIEQAVHLGGIWTAGTRARRIGEMLKHDRRFDERDLLKMQHDTRVIIFDFYRDVLIEAAERQPPGNELARRALEIVHGWNGRADGDQPAMHLLDQYRRALESRVLAPLVAPCRELDEQFTYRWFMSDEVVMRIIEERPEHLLPAEYDDWDDFLLSAWDAALRRIHQGANPPANGVETPWSEVNQLHMAHPLSSVMPFLAQRLDMQPSPQAGHSQAVRVLPYCIKVLLEAACATSMGTSSPRMQVVEDHRLLSTRD